MSLSMGLPSNSQGLVRSLRVSAVLCCYWHKFQNNVSGKVFTATCKPFLTSACEEKIIVFFHAFIFHIICQINTFESCAFWEKGRGLLDDKTLDLSAVCLSGDPQRMCAFPTCSSTLSSDHHSTFQTAVNYLVGVRAWQISPGGW